MPVVSIDSNVAEHAVEALAGQPALVERLRQGVDALDDADHVAVERLVAVDHPVHRVERLADVDARVDAGDLRARRQRRPCLGLAQLSKFLAEQALHLR
ncbi:hypothetical protein [Nannocystis pusilla]|uniref:hypothetical protein n=1 Tax=Nannocystis pusilla TaxID=889268 RepID=UPI003DA65E20